MGVLNCKGSGWYQFIDSVVVVTLLTIFGLSKIPLCCELEVRVDVATCERFQEGLLVVRVPVLVGTHSSNQRNQKNGKQRSHIGVSGVNNHRVVGIQLSTV